MRYLAVWRFNIRWTMDSSQLDFCLLARSLFTHTFLLYFHPILRQAHYNAPIYSPHFAASLVSIRCSLCWHFIWFHHFRLLPFCRTLVESMTWWQGWRLWIAHDMSSVVWLVQWYNYIVLLPHGEASIISHWCTAYAMYFFYENGR